MSSEKKVWDMLNSTILDWNRPSQLTSIDAKENYDKLVPAVQKLLVEAEQLGRDRQQHEMIGYIESLGIDEKLSKIVIHFTRSLQLGADYRPPIKEVSNG